MTLNELQTLPEFSIWNEHGRITFQGSRARGSPGLDLTEVDLGSVVNIVSRGVAVYEELPAGQFKPGAGQKLNVPSIITLFKVSPRAGGSPRSFEEKLRHHLEKDNEANGTTGDDRAEHISYSWTTHEWTFRVPHFTRWGAQSDEEDDAQPEAEQEQMRDWR